MSQPQLDLKNPINFSDEILKAVVQSILKQDLPTICPHWNYNWTSQLLKFELAKNNHDTGRIQQPADVLMFADIINARRNLPNTRKTTC